MLGLIIAERLAMFCGCCLVVSWIVDGSGKKMRLLVKIEGEVAVLRVLLCFWVALKICGKEGAEKWQTPKNKVCKGCRR